MQLTLNGKNIEITNALRNYVNEKLERIVKHNGQLMNVKVTLSVTKNPSVKNSSIAEVTCFLNGSAIKITESAETMYAALDLLADKLDRRVREIKKKLVGKGKHTTESIRVTAVEEGTESAEEEEETESVP
jgi:putative sigma-54 modulation protein